MKPQSVFTPSVFIRTITLIIISMTFCFSAQANVFKPIDPVGDQYWQNRDDLSSVVKAIEIYENLLKKDPQNVQLLVRLSIGYYWKAFTSLDVDGKQDFRKAAFKRGMDYAQTALNVDPKSVPAHFWYASNKARFGAEVGIMKSLTSLKDMRSKIQYVLDHDKFYYYGGPQRYMGKLICSVPSLLRKSLTGGTLEDAENMLKQAIDYQPAFLISYVFLSEVYMKEGKEDLAKQQLLKALSIKESDLPEFAAEIRFHGKIARQQYKEYFGDK